MKKIKKKKAVVEFLKLDLGCGPNKRAGFLGVDNISFSGVDLVHDLRTPWPWEKESVEEVHCSHFLEHLTNDQRVHFWNELYRVMKVGAKAQIIVPHWSSGRAYGDPTHQWPPVVEFSFYYLDKGWREVNAPHCGLTCDFLATWGYNIHTAWQARNQEAQMFALNHYRDVAQDLIATVTKR
jgi:hypothetical protein